MARRLSSKSLISQPMIKKAKSVCGRVLAAVVAAAIVCAPVMGWAQDDGHKHSHQLVHLKPDAPSPVLQLPRAIELPQLKAGHIQGLAVDVEKKCLYVSFTTAFVKVSFSGEVLGTVTGFTGHLGDVAFNHNDGKVYASLEFKGDAIGKSVNALVGDAQGKVAVNRFCVAIIDVQKIQGGKEFDASAVCEVVSLPTVREDYEADVTLTDGRVVRHRHGCSGIDGIAFGPKFGSKRGMEYLTVAYGIYSDVNRDDNDFQVLLQYDVSEWAKYSLPLTAENVVAESGPQLPNLKCLVRTGNTRYGVQNLTHDTSLNLWVMGVYAGEKEQLPNYNVFVVDGDKRPGRRGGLRGVPYVKNAELLPVLVHEVDASESEDGRADGWYFDYGTTGMAAIGDGYYYICVPYSNQHGHGGTVFMYKWQGGDEVLERVN